MHYMEIPSIISVKLAEAESLGLTQAQLFNEADVDLSSLSKWRKGHMPNMGTVNKLEAVLIKFRKSKIQEQDYTDKTDANP